MVVAQDTRCVVKLLRKAGWKPIRHAGSHTTWESPTGVKFTLADGHKTISAGVYRELLKVMEGSGQ